MNSGKVLMTHMLAWNIEGVGPFSTEQRTGGIQQLVLSPLSMEINHSEFNKSWKQPAQRLCPAKIGIHYLLLLCVLVLWPRVGRLS